MTCAEVVRQLDAWLTGALNDADARRIEEHGAICAACEERLDAISRGPRLAPSVEPPAQLRDATLRAVARRRSVIRWRRAAGTVAAMAAIVLVAITMQPQRKSGSSFPAANRILLAQDRARGDFAEIDRAEREVETALNNRPDDIELAGALARIRGQREALRQLVSQASQ